MYAVFKTGGKQYRVTPGDRLRVEKLTGAVGEGVTFEQVLLVRGEQREGGGQGEGGGALQLGKPLLSGAKVEAKIVAQGLGPKIVIFRLRRRKNYRRKKGHRQPFTALEITKIVA